uniref:G-protein coupled receptors family 1 profile domain-containing protein n=1 Tax=Romanomermis culicivorax TaxID=13658 RepID=A0A915HHD6_ROMCU
MEDMIAALMYGSTSITLLTLYIGCTYVLLTSQNLGSPSYYAIASILAITDILQLLFNGVAATFFLLLPGLDHKLHLLNKWCGAICVAAWYAYGLTANLLAFNRAYLLIEAYYLADNTNDTNM